MSHFWDFSLFLFAEAGNAVAPAADAGNGGGQQFPFQLALILGGGLVLMYVLMILPQKKERDRWNKMVDGLKKNDRVLLQSGIIGTVHSVDKEKLEIVLKIDDSTNTKVTCLLTAIARVLPNAGGEAAK